MDFFDKGKRKAVIDEEPIIASKIRLAGFALALIHLVVIYFTLHPEQVLLKDTVNNKETFLYNIERQFSLNETDRQVLRNMIDENFITRYRTFAIGKDWILKSTKFRTIFAPKEYLPQINSFTHTLFIIMLAYGIIGAILGSELIVEAFVILPKNSKQRIVTMVQLGSITLIYATIIYVYLDSYRIFITNSVVINTSMLLK